MAGCCRSVLVRRQIERFAKIGLSVSWKKQMVCALYQLAFLLPYDTRRRKIFTHTAIALLGKQRNGDEQGYENE